MSQTKSLEDLFYEECTGAGANVCVRCCVLLQDSMRIDSLLRRMYMQLHGQTMRRKRHAHSVDIISFVGS